MTNWYNEPEFQDWNQLFLYAGAVIELVIDYKFEEYPEGYIRVKFRDEAAGVENYTDNGLRTIEEAREYIEQYKEKLMKLAAYEQELEFY